MEEVLPAGNALGEGQENLYVVLLKAHRLTADFGSKLRLEVLLQLRHHGFYLLVGEGLVGILKDEADGIRLAALGDTLADIDIEERDALQQLLLGGASHSLYLVEGDAGVEHKCQVATHLGEFGYLAIGHILRRQRFKQQIPVDVAIEDLLLAVHLLEVGGSDATHDGQLFLAVAELEYQTLREEMLGGRDNLKALHWYAETMQDVDEMSLGIEEVDGLLGRTPTFALDGTGHEKGKVLCLGVSLCYRSSLVVLLQSVAFGSDLIGASELVNLLVEDFVVHIIGDALKAAPQQRATHDVKLLRQRIEDADIIFAVEIGVILIIVALGQRVVKKRAAPIMIG